MTHNFKNIQAGSPLSIKGREGTIVIDFMMIGFVPGWQIRYLGTIAFAKKEEEIIRFLDEHELRPPIRDEPIVIESLF
ncbi:hypothetical protein [Thermoactinomyces sp. DSM 45892]|uniref:hypothetical protein n=1 Tax=Thermoactinomyces sp. DSM 45892 TaxID=1882753 RepID=UPI00089AF126|nr:hypothetical protein [Thermoactinomyces sp. DSM 45892]SDY85431.1 hypothetical protein SAMN05444416_10981 [Thermoactinomyces sp. DSM 45892]